MESYRNIGEDFGEASAHMELGLIYEAFAYSETHNPDKAEEHFSEALASFRIIRDGYGEADALSRLGFLAYDHGDGANAARLLEQALTIYERLGIDDAWVDEVRTTVDLLDAQQAVRP